MNQLIIQFFKNLFKNPWFDRSKNAISAGRNAIRVIQTKKWIFSLFLSILLTWFCSINQEEPDSIFRMKYESINTKEIYGLLKRYTFWDFIKLGNIILGWSWWVCQIVKKIDGTTKWGTAAEVYEWLLIIGNKSVDLLLAILVSTRRYGVTIKYPLLSHSKNVIQASRNAVRIPRTKKWPFSLLLSILLAWFCSVNQEEPNSIFAKRSDFWDYTEIMNNVLGWTWWVCEIMKLIHGNTKLETVPQFFLVNWLAMLPNIEKEKAELWVASLYWSLVVGIKSVDVLFAILVSARGFVVEEAKKGWLNWNGWF